MPSAAAGKVAGVAESAATKAADYFGTLRSKYGLGTAAAGEGAATGGKLFGLKNMGKLAVFLFLLDEAYKRLKVDPELQASESKRAEGDKAVTRKAQDKMLQFMATLEQADREKEMQDRSDRIQTINAPLKVRESQAVSAGVSQPSQADLASYLANVRMSNPTAGQQPATQVAAPQSNSMLDILGLLD